MEKRWGESPLLEVFPRLVQGTAQHSKRRTSSGDQGGREGRDVKRGQTLDIHLAALRFIGKDT